MIAAEAEMKTFTGKTVVITGGTRGIGKCLADKLREAGNTVVVLSRTAETDGRCSFALDVSDEKAVRSVFDKIAENFNGIDVLFNNAGYGQSGAVELIDSAALDRIVAVNLMGVVNCTRAALPHMKEGGKIINISSAASFVPMPFRTMYSVTKCGVNMFTRGMRQELAGTDIQTTALCLGDIKTEFASRRDKDTETSPRYGDRIRRADAFVEKRAGSKGKADLGKTADAIIREASKKKFRALRIIGAKWKLTAMLVRNLPADATDGLMTKVFSEK